MDNLVDRLREFAAEPDNSMPNLTNEAADEIVRLNGQLNLLKRTVSRLPLCPDHRDKVRDRCVECDNERLRKLVNE